MPELDRFYRDHKNDTGILLVAYDQSAADVNAVLADQGVDIPVLLDSTGEVAGAYQVEAFPTEVFIDPSGAIVRSDIGALTSSAMWKVLAPMATTTTEATTTTTEATTTTTEATTTTTEATAATTQPVTNTTRGAGTTVAAGAGSNITGAPPASGAPKGGGNVSTNTQDGGGWPGYALALVIAGGVILGMGIVTVAVLGRRASSARGFCRNCGSPRSGKREAFCRSCGAKY